MIPLFPVGLSRKNAKVHCPMLSFYEGTRVQIKTEATWWLQCTGDAFSSC